MDGVEKEVNDQIGPINYFCNAITFDILGLEIFLLKVWSSVGSMYVCAREKLD